jgi:hypothetical protein
VEHVGVHSDVAEALAILERAGMPHSAVVSEPDNSEYGAMVCRIRDRSVRFRAGKVTPTKSGMFVTVWRRAAGGSTGPFDDGDGVDVLVVTARDVSRFGFFVFPEATLVDRGIVSVGGRGGKRGFRVYPPWIVTASAQAARTQRWQCDHFVEVRALRDGGEDRRPDSSEFRLDDGGVARLRHVFAFDRIG